MSATIMTVFTNSSRESICAFELPGVAVVWVATQPSVPSRPTGAVLTAMQFPYNKKRGSAAVRLPYFDLWSRLRAALLHVGRRQQARR